MNQSTFDKYAAEGFTHAPLVHTLLADFETPLSVYHKLANAPYSYLLESVQGGDKWGRYSIIGLPCDSYVRIAGREVSYWQGGKCEKVSLSAGRGVVNPLDWVEEFQAGFKVVEDASLPKFSGGLVGYFGYDSVRFMEPEVADVSPAKDDIATPDVVLLVSREFVVFDNLSGKVHVIIQADLSEPNSFSKAEARIAELVAKLAEPLAKTELEATQVGVAEEDFVSSFGEEPFKQAVSKIKDYIAQGEAEQIVISQRMSLPFAHSPLDLYRGLRYLNPSPYMFYLNLDDFFVVGSSPEILVRLEDETVTVRPIAGTRKRGATYEQDLALEQELLADPKEVAEHLMLIDLSLADLSPVAVAGSLAVTEKKVVERYSHVMHLVSNVEAKVKPDLSALDVLKASFPAGTVSGAPRARAMQVIDELEPVKRGVYAGAVGYLGWHGNMDMSIAIRTAVIKDKTLFMQAGAGIVADSVPQNEWDETMNKGRAIFRAAEFVSQGLRT